MAIPFETWGARPHEIDAAMVGDDLIDDAAMSATRAIDLGGPPDVAFDWLTQMGFGRAGWYSYDLIDNLGRRSARRIDPEWQVSRAGDRVPGGPVDFTAAVVDPPHAFVLSLLGQRLAGHRIDFTLAYVLSPMPCAAAQPAANATDQEPPEGHRHEPAARPDGNDELSGSRLVCRARATIDGPAGRLVVPLLCLGDGIMVRRQLLGIRERCAP